MDKKDTCLARKGSEAQHMTKIEKCTHLDNDIARRALAENYFTRFQFIEKARFATDRHLFEERIGGKSAFQKAKKGGVVLRRPPICHIRSVPANTAKKQHTQASIPANVCNGRREEPNKHQENKNDTESLRQTEEAHIA